jgi:hypothetical protein
MDRDGVIFSYSGPVNQAVVEGFGNVLRERLKRDNIGMGESIKIFSIFVEQLQNVIYYSDGSSDDNLNSGMIIIGNRDDHYFISGSNEVTKEQKERVDDKLQKILSMTPEELKKEYKSARKRDSDEYSKGAGLGFLEMARKSSEPIKYQFEKISENRYYFTVNITV